jgi:hypothetical protein
MTTGGATRGVYAGGAAGLALAGAAKIGLAVPATHAASPNAVLQALHGSAHTGWDPAVGVERISLSQGDGQFRVLLACHLTGSGARRGLVSLYGELPATDGTGAAPGTGDDGYAKARDTISLVGLGTVEFSVASGEGSIDAGVITALGLVSGARWARAATVTDAGSTEAITGQPIRSVQASGVLDRALVNLFDPGPFRALWLCAGRPESSPGVAAADAADKVVPIVTVWR